MSRARGSPATRRRSRPQARRSEASAKGAAGRLWRRPGPKLLLWCIGALALALGVIGLRSRGPASPLALTTPDWNPAQVTPAPLPTPMTAALEPAAARQLQEAAEGLAAAAGGPAQALGQAYGHYGMLLLAYELPGAGAAIDSARRLSPYDHRWHWYLADLAASEGRVDEAIALYRVAQALEPGELSTGLRMAELYLELGDPAAARPWVEAAIESDADYYWSYVLLARIATAEGRHRDARQLYERALALEPGAKMLYRPLAQSLRELGEFEAAAAMLERAESIPYPRREPLITALADLRVGDRAKLRRAGGLLSEGRLEQAIELLESVAEAQPGNLEALSMLASAQSRAGRTTSALVASKRAVEGAESDALGWLAWYTHGQVLAQAGRSEEAESAWQHALAIDPRDARVHAELAAFYRREARFAEAATHYDRWLEAEPDRVLSYVERAMCLLRRGRTQDAIQGLESSLGLYPEDRDLGDALARVLATAPDLEASDRDRALELAARNLERSRALDTLETMAMARAATGDYDSAISLQQEALQLAEEARQAEWWSAMRSNLDRYQAGLPAIEAWPDFIYRR